MPPKIAVIGSTGLIGLEFLKSLAGGDYQEVTAITRREIPSLFGRPFIRQAIHDFSDLESMRSELKTDVLVCALGTTIKTAGSQKRFFEVDHDIPLTLAKIAREEGCHTFILVSSMGANAQSKIFYSRVKGQLEDALKKLGFPRLDILRPSMLLGDRQEKRRGEFIGKLIMQPLSFLIPWKYKPIQASTVAAKIHDLSTATGEGTSIWFGKSLFNKN
ncbi:MAG: NAD-dependent epimerase/dehydratase family protein [Candidatus Marinimicrobia bacterium]|nr:NAD-dependent epimerase/dehydratase family protein [Candidatus Neomarinimicrobiota bacterium]MCF7923181.1 NAD-dependent epimerase/dehydratase family protein [Candidatus Neomarinimicrobiota bacterium]